MNRKNLTKRYLAAAVALFVMIAILTGCAALPTLPSAAKISITIDEFMVKTENSGGAKQTIAPMSSMLGIPKRVSGDVMLTEEVKEESVLSRFYNLTDGKLLVTVGSEDRAGFVSDHLKNPQSAAGVFYQIHNDVMHFYNADGTIAFSSLLLGDGSEDSEEDGEAETKMPVISDALNGFSLNGVEYYVRDGFLTYEDDSPLDSSYFNAGVPYLNYRYYIDEDHVFVFDNGGALVYAFHMPSYAVDSWSYVLADGTVFIQYLYTVTDGETHDFVRQGSKYKLTSILANPSKNTETSPVLSFFVIDLHNAYTDEDFHQRYTEKVSNLAKVIRIENQRIDENHFADITVLSNSLLELFSYDDVVTGALDIGRISHDRYLVTTAAGGLLVSGKGDMIGHLNNYQTITEKFIMTSGKIYDHDLKEIFDLTREGYAYFADVGDNIILSKVEEDVAQLYLFSGEEPVLITPATAYIPCYEGYAILGEDSCRYYNEEGKLIAEADGVITWLYEKEQEEMTTHVGYTINEEGYLKYYRLQFHNAYQG